MELNTILDFLTDLSNNNNREWFLKNKKKYEQARGLAEKFTEQIIPEIMKFDKQIPATKAKDCFFRINRDVRFSKDKNPYKTNMGAYISKGGRKGPFSGYYIHFEPGSCFLAGGVHMPLPENLRAIRNEIYFNYTPFQKIVQNKQFVKYFGKISGDSLVRVPKDYPADHEAAEFLKLKNFAVIHPFDDKELLSADFMQKALAILELIKPLNHFLNQAIENNE